MPDSTGAVDAAALQAWVREFARLVAEQREHLTELDAAIGDADHGSNMDRGLTAVVAALDAVFGGLRAYLERIFDSKVFVVSFVFNVLVAALIVWVGDQLGVGTQLTTAIIVVLGIRIFGNAAALRRRLFGA